MKRIAGLIFKFRSYTPLPFLAVMLIFQDTTPASFLSGILLVLLGESLRFWGVSYAGSETRTTGSVGGSFLVISGPFAYVRNPLYTGNILIYSGIGIISMSLFPYLQLGALIFFIFQYRLIIWEEERHLRETYGDAYEAYFRSVPRFIPRITPYTVPGLKQPPYNPKSGLISEKRTIQALSAVVILLLIIWYIKQV